ncbi:MAG: RNA polymerase sigma factor [Ignavibacteriales bacterium]|nr:RNA polymerase sigma factor [Ignavibacteriales bacterium]
MSEAKSADSMTDSDLILKVKGGDMMAFEQLVHRYDKQVLSMAASYVNSSDDAKDIYQEVFLRVYRGLKKFEHRSEFSTWLYRIATNVCLSHRSRRKRHAHASLHSDEGDDEAHGVQSNARSDDPTLGSEISAHIEDALKALSPRQRMVFTLKHFEEYKIREIARMMKCSEGTVKRYLFTATRKMRDQLKHLHHEEQP